MTPQEIALIRSSFAIAVTKKNPLTAHFYEDLFRVAPDLRPLFPEDMHAQRDKLLHALSYCVKHLDDLDTLLPTIQDLAKRHVNYGATPEHYAVVVDTLIAALRRTCGPVFSAQTELAWLVALNALTQTMIETAGQPYRKAG